MAEIIQGFYREDTPYFRLRVWGEDPSLAMDVEAVLDTGFSGFVMIPNFVALRIGLRSPAATEVTMADGKRSPASVARGIASIGDRDHEGLIIVGENPEEILIGIEFIRAFNLFIVLTPQSVQMLELGSLRRPSKPRRGAS